MNYEDMSDYQLSAELLKLKGFTLHEQTMQLPHSTCVGRDEDDNVLVFDINNPSDIMPLVFERGISLIKDSCNFGSKEGYFALNEFSGMGLDDYDCEWNKGAKNKNPYRAAAIVILMMESKA